MSFIKKYFTFNKRERNGILALFFILLFVIISIQLLPFFVKPPENKFSQFEKELADMENSKIEFAQSKDSTNKVILSKDEEEVNNLLQKTSLIDPNTASENDFKNIGLSPKIIRTLLKYRGKGAKFKKKTDLKKIFGMNDAIYNSIEKLIFIEGDTVIKSDNTVANNKPQQKLELNSADSLSFVMLKGIGPSFAHRIIAYRNRLGGFCDIAQLKEVYGMDSTRYNSMLSSITVDSSLISQININSASVQDLKKHPYINHNLANLIVAYRNAHGNYKAVEDVKKLNLVTDDLYRKLAPYLIVN